VIGHKVSSVSRARESLDNAHRFKLAYAEVLSVVLVVVLLAGIGRFVVTGQLPESVVGLALGMCYSVARLLPPWTTDLGRPGGGQEGEEASYRKSE
jgi:hypothetical protein